MLSGGLLAREVLDYALCGAISAAKGHHRAPRGPANTVAVHVQCAVQRGAGQCRAVQGRACTCQNQKIHDLRPQKRGGHFLTPPPPPPPSLKTSKKWVSSGGGLGGSGPKTHWGMRLLDKIMILQGVKLTIQPLGVGYANRPKKAKMGGYVAFSPIYACLALI